MDKLIIPSKTERLFEKKSFLLTRGHGFVEIGGIKWATCNIGAEKPTDIGLYFQWGDTQGYTAEQVGIGEGKKFFSWGDYRYISDDLSDIIKYNCVDNKRKLDVSDDAVHAAWGGAWRMPTREEFDILGETADVAWTENYQGSGVSGLVCVDKTDSSKELFFPAAGDCYNDKVEYAGHSGFYWSSISNNSYFGSSYGMGFGRYDLNFGSYSPRNYGGSMRGVC